MTPREKAKDLINRYIELTDDCNCSEYFCLCISMSKDKSKECALITVDEMLKEHFGDFSSYGTRRFNFLKEVKQEIENYE